MEEEEVEPGGDQGHNRRGTATEIHLMGHAQILTFAFFPPYSYLINQ